MVVFITCEGKHMYFGALQCIYPLPMYILLFLKMFIPNNVRYMHVTNITVLI